MLRLAALCTLLVPRLAAAVIVSVVIYLSACWLLDRIEDVMSRPGHAPLRSALPPSAIVALLLRAETVVAIAVALMVLCAGVRSA